MNKRGFSLIESLSAAAVLAISCAYICSAASLANRSTAKSLARCRDILQTCSRMEETKSAAFELLETGPGLEIEDIDEYAKILRADINGFKIDAIRSKFR